MGRKKDRKTVCLLSESNGNKISDRPDREKWSTSKGGPVVLRLFRLDRTDPLSFRRKFSGNFS